MCRLLGFRFAPRIRDLKEKRLYLLPGMIVSSSQWAKPQCNFNLKDMLSASLISFGVIAEARCIDAQLLSDEGA